ncbi:MAG: sugar phosphate isomerase/epimerase, partial [Lentisphaerae bacterium]|nr:sugar phosphate isomerase/epimerase [Lentisphaerota bacterium]
MKIGVIVESFRVGLEAGLQAAADLGIQGVQIYATSGVMHPDNLDSAARAKLRTQISDLGLEISALCGDFGGHGFQIAEDNQRRIEVSHKIMDLAVELGCRVITTHIGSIPAQTTHPRYVIMAKACEQLGRLASQTGVTFAIETGPEPAAVLRDFLEDLQVGPGLGVNFDPANLVMVCREDIPAAVQTLAPYIVHTHAKDGINLKPVDPETLYRSFAEPVPGFRAGDYISEVPLGKGQVPFEAYLQALRQHGFDGYLTIEREVGQNPRQDIEEAVKFLRA